MLIDYEKSRMGYKFTDLIFLETFLKRDYLTNLISNKGDNLYQSVETMEKHLLEGPDSANRRFRNTHDFVINFIKALNKIVPLNDTEIEKIHYLCKAVVALSFIKFKTTTPDQAKYLLTLSSYYFNIVNYF